MLKQLSLQNFKAFGKNTVIDLAPITLIFGANSAGKSSILQSLSLLKQTYELGQGAAALLPRVEGNFVDLGSYHELIFDHDAKRKLKIGITATGPSREVSPFAGTVGSGLDIEFRRNARNGQVVISHLAIRMEGTKTPAATFKIRRPKRDELKQLRRYGYFGGLPGRARLAGKSSPEFVAECTRVTADEEFWRPIYDEWYERRTEVVDFLKEELQKVRDMPSDDSPFDGPESHADNYASAIDFFSRRFGWKEYVERVALANVGKTVFMDGLFPEPVRIPDMFSGLPELEMLFLSRGEGRRFKRFFDACSLAYFTGRAVANALEMMFPMGPYRRPPERWYIYTGTNPLDVGYKGDHLPDLLYQNDELVKKANHWLKELEIGYKIRVKPVGDEDQSDLFELRLVDQNRDVEVALSDVGFGISQILPFLVQSLSSEKRIISIEQPEVHIHPRLQADLGNLIAEGIRKPHNHQYLIETHSEHLILRIQKLIRNKQSDLRPEDVSVLYVSREESGSEVTRLRLDENGDFIDEWPGGFFAERLEELI